MPRRNTVGRTLGGRDKDKMTDCPMVLALILEGKTREVADTHSHTHSPTCKRRYNHAHEKHLGCSWCLISEQARAVVAV